MNKVKIIGIFCAVPFAGSNPCSATHLYDANSADPFHPNCKRAVEVTGSTANGTDGTSGCPADGSSRAWKLLGSVEGDKILVDFRPKGGPANLKGVYDSTAPEGIKWPDGNKWTKL